MRETIKIYCQNCKAYILDCDMAKLALPFKGWMFTYPPLTEWDTAFEPEATGNDLVCPMCDSKFHEEPYLMCEFIMPRKGPELGWMFVPGAYQPDPKIPKGHLEKRVEEAKLTFKLAEEKKPDEPKGKRKPRRSRKAAIKPNPRQNAGTKNRDNGDDDKSRANPAKHFSQLGFVEEGGSNVDECPGFDD